MTIPWRRLQWFIGLCCLLVPSLGLAQPEKVIFSAPGGFYDESFTLELSCLHPQNRVFYTLNGNTPTVHSHLFKDPLRLDSEMYSNSDIYTIQISPDPTDFVPDSVGHCIVIRAAVFDENDSIVSKVVTNSYFIHSLNCNTHGLPVISICADSLDLFDYERGIMVPGINFDAEHPDHWTGNYYMKGRDWERLSNVEFYELDNTGINQLSGLRTHGGNARRFVQKGLKIYAREEYGKKRFKHRFFESTEVESFKHLVLKPYCCSSTAGGMQDYVCCQLARGLNFESLATRPCVLFLNGEYWGIYYLQEKGDERYLEDHLGVDIEHCDIICDWWPVTLELGSDEDYLALMDWLGQADLSIPMNYQYLSERIDLDCFIDYYAFELFISNQDWPANNVRFWRENNGKWRWLFFDGDAGVVALDYDAFGPAVYVGDQTWPSCTEATLMFRKLLENKEFCSRFQSRFESLLDTHFHYDSTYPALAYISNTLHDEIPNQSRRFRVPYHPSWWPSEIEKIRHYLEERPSDALAQLRMFMAQYSVVSNLLSSLSAYPNPFHDQLRLSFLADAVEPYPLDIYDLTGRCVFSTMVDPRTNYLDLSLDLAPGMYILKLGAYTQKVFKR
ncbi:MAG: CotH kinase family protein [Bacteroidales bacterium]|nr:CotH kinase family protein [Bacteroidales bacterium]